MAFYDGKGMGLVYCDELSRQGSVGKLILLSSWDLCHGVICRGWEVT